MNRNNRNFRGAAAFDRRSKVERWAPPAIHAEVIFMNTRNLDTWVLELMQKELACRQQDATLARHDQFGHPVELSHSRETTRKTVPPSEFHPA